MRLGSPAVAEIGDTESGSALAALQDHGFVVLRALLSDAELAAARDHADDLLRGADWSDNGFDGRRTRRVYSLLKRVGSLEPLLLHPEVHHLVTACLGEVYQFGMLFLSAVDPGQGAQQLHFDAGSTPFPGRWRRRSTSSGRSTTSPPATVLP
ncbi:phytanoyl-CoA dioxygenase family protein [Phytohabitans rumicis]|uniref:phytanoyl-CoA dioxygenase family protein n=1 Tax=Phytohabitans rumicis TaxID=1076125 RepID=UPI00353063EB